MKFSFQTVWILFGVTLVHLFLISAFLPTGGELQSSLSNSERSPLHRKPVQPALAATDPAAVTDFPPVGESNPANDTGEEIPKMKLEPAIPTSDSQAEVLTPLKGLVETGAGESSPVVVDEPALSPPPRGIREIRDLKAVRRS